MCQDFIHFSVFLHHLVSAELASSSIRVKFKFLEGKEIFLNPVYIKRGWQIHD